MCRFALFSQHVTRPSDRRPHAWYSPTVTSTYAPFLGEESPMTPQHSTRRSVRTAQVEENPRETDRYLSALSKTPDSAGEGGSDFDLPGLLPAFFLAPSLPMPQAAWSWWPCPAPARRGGRCYGRGASPGPRCCGDVSVTRSRSCSTGRGRIEPGRRGAASGTAVRAGHDPGSYDRSCGTSGPKGVPGVPRLPSVSQEGSCGLS